MKKFCVLFNWDMLSKRVVSYRNILMYGFLLSTIFFAACSGKLGTIEHQDVDTQIKNAEQAIKTAREANAPSLAFEEFEQAETYLERAKDALKDNNGLDTLKFANQAITYAKIAQRKAAQNTTNAEYNAHILEKDALISDLRKDLKTNESKKNGLERHIQQLLETEKELQQNIHTLENQNRELGDDQKQKQQKVAELNESLKDIQNRVASSEANLHKYGLQVKELSRKLEVADTIAKSASKQKRAAIAESESLKKQMREQASIFTKQLAAANKRNIAVEHAEYMRNAADEARAFEKQLHSNEPKRTGRTSLSTQQINAGKALLGKWENAWNSKNLDAHFALYIPNISVNKIIIRDSKEIQTNINRSEIESGLREMNAKSWEKSDSNIEVEKESVIGTYIYRRLVSPAETEDDTALYDIWTREIWTHQVQNNWKIHREIWQIYENVPIF